MSYILPAVDILRTLQDTLQSLPGWCNQEGKILTIDICHRVLVTESQNHAVGFRSTYILVYSFVAESDDEGTVNKARSGRELATA